nr:uncharacterized protein LOC103909484 [Danio rerio]|eukprot:XP_021333863.1 uncharacterized protein LOC103909484 [Danio rerio]
MKILLIFILTLQLISGQISSLSATGYSGGSLMLDSGKLWVSDSAKYLAKLPDWRTIINDTKHERWINEGRFTLFKNNDGNLMIFIRDLNTDDAGRYAVDVEQGKRLYMILNVEEDSCCNMSKRVTVNSGETAVFSCEYSHNQINHAKVILKPERDSIEMIYSTLNKQDRFSISDDRQRNSFSVSITAVTAGDGGVYLCGVWVNKHSYSYYITNTVHLQIMGQEKQSDAAVHTPLPTTPSDETIVIFQKHAETLRVAADAFMTDEVYSDYTMVIYYTELN